MSEGERVLGDDPLARLVSAFEANGFPRMPASVLIAIMTSEEGVLTAERLSERLQVSPAAISGAVRYLSTVRMVHRHRLPGTRRYAYEVPEHAWYAGSLEQGELYLLLARLAEEATSTVGPRGREQLQEMAAFFRFLERRMPEVLQEWRDQRARPDS
jgi:predicted transcriptional regulator